MVQFLWDMVYNWKVIVTIETENHFQNYSFSDSDERRKDLLTERTVNHWYW